MIEKAKPGCVSIREKESEAVMENKLTPELIEQVKQAQSPEEIKKLAEENGIELTEESARAYYEKLHSFGELSDEELSSVAGGGCHYKDGRLVITTLHFCSYWTCKKCGDPSRDYKKRPNSWGSHKCPDGYVVAIHGCDNCIYMSYEHGLWLCNNELNYK